MLLPFLIFFIFQLSAIDFTIMLYDMKDKKPKLIVFCKEPAPSKVKTRMVPPLTHIQAAVLYDSFLKETLRLCSKTSGVQKILCFHPPKSSRYLDTLIDSSWDMQPQVGKNLGERLAHALETNLKGGPALIVGTDCPSLPKDFIYAAIKALNHHKIVLGPAIDGGFYLLGLKSYYHGIFNNISWSSQKTLGDLLRNIGSQKIKPFMLPRWYDIDDIEDFRLLLSHLRCLPEKELKITRGAVNSIMGCENIKNGHYPIFQRTKKEVCRPYKHQYRI